MEQTKIINIKSVGDVLLRKSKRAKRINISIKPGNKIIVSIPRLISFKHGENFVTEQLDWIKKSLSKIENIEKGRLIFTDGFSFSTKHHNIYIKQTDTQKIFADFPKPEITIHYPKFMNVNDKEVQNAIRSLIVEILRAEAKEYLPKRVKQLAQKHDFSFNKVFVKNLKSRWGSCSNKNNINLNIHLMRTADELIDYVILHELSHTVEKNHGKEFWNLLNRITNNKAKKLDKKLKLNYLNF